MKTDKGKASDETYCCTFNLQEALPFPKLSTSIAYYKHNLYVYNFGVHSFNNNVGYMYVWDETKGGRGSQDISSIAVRYPRERASKHKDIILYSDACGGQNQNIKMSLTLLKLVNSTDIAAESTDHKFMMSGHSPFQRHRLCSD